MIPFAPSVKILAIRFSSANNTGPNFFARLATAIPNFDTARPPSFAEFLPAMITVVSIPAMDIATADNPTMFSLAHFLTL